MSNVLSEEKKQQVIALGKLGWSLRKIERETGVRRETAGAYLRAVGIAVRIPRAWGRGAPAKPANELTPDLAKPANEVTPDFVGLFSQLWEHSWYQMVLSSGGSDTQSEEHTS